MTDKIRHLLHHIEDQVEKGQYLNASTAAVDLQKELMAELSSILKRDNRPLVVAGWSGQDFKVER